MLLPVPVATAAGAFFPAAAHFPSRFAGGRKKIACLILFGPSSLVTAKCKVFAVFLTAF
jgi:hypothetical protein